MSLIQGQKVIALRSEQGLKEGVVYTLKDIEEVKNQITGSFLGSTKLYKFQDSAGEVVAITKPKLVATLDSGDSFTQDPLTEKGKKIMSSMQKGYGKEKGEQVFYASKNAGKVEGVDSKTKDNYRETLQKLRDQLEKAKQEGDTDKVRDLEIEIKDFIKETADANGLIGAKVSYGSTKGTVTGILGGPSGNLVEVTWENGEKAKLNANVLKFEQVNIKYKAEQDADYKVRECPNCKNQLTYAGEESGKIKYKCGLCGKKFVSKDAKSDVSYYKHFNIIETGMGDFYAELEPSMSTFYVGKPRFTGRSVIEVKSLIDKWVQEHKSYKDSKTKDAYLEIKEDGWYVFGYHQNIEGPFTEREANEEVKSGRGRKIKYFRKGSVVADSKTKDQEIKIIIGEDPVNSSPVEQKVEGTDLIYREYTLKQIPESGEFDIYSPGGAVIGHAASVELAKNFVDQISVNKDEAILIPYAQFLAKEAEGELQASEWSQLGGGRWKVMVYSKSSGRKIPAIIVGVPASEGGSKIKFSKDAWSKEAIKASIEARRKKKQGGTSSSLEPKKVKGPDMEHEKKRVEELIDISKKRGGRIFFSEELDKRVMNRANKITSEEKLKAFSQALLERGLEKYYWKVKGLAEEKFSKKGGSIEGVKISEDKPESTKVDSVQEIPRTQRMKPPSTAGIFVPTKYRPVDYGEVGELLQEKYGQKRGEEMYQGMVDRPSGDNSGLFFVVGKGIVAEKMAMMKSLGKTGDPREHSYQGLYTLYGAKSTQKDAWSK